MHFTTYRDLETFFTDEETDIWRNTSVQCYSANWGPTQTTLAPGLVLSPALVPMYHTIFLQERKD